MAGVDEEDLLLAEKTRKGLRGLRYVHRWRAMRGCGASRCWDSLQSSPADAGADTSTPPQRPGQAAHAGRGCHRIRLRKQGRRLLFPRATNSVRRSCPSTAR